MNTEAGAIADKFKNADKAFDELKIKSVDEKIVLLKKLRSVISDNLDEIVSVICKETGKVKTEALASDMFPSLDALNYLIKNLKRMLSEKKVKSSLFFFRDKCRIEYRPSGTALVISPWNFPFFLAFVPVVNAIASGCSIILKPSEITPETGKVIEELFKKAGFPESSVQCVYGGAEVVQASIRQKPSRVLFTGSTKTGREIGKLCGELLIPAVLELGGKAPAVVCDDIDIKRVSNGIVYGAFMNNGQVCVAITRIIVDAKIKEKFIEALIEKAGKILLDRDYGKLIQPEKIPYLNELIDDAVSKGAKIIYKDKKNTDFSAPVIIDGVNPQMRLFNEECFAPVLAVTSYETEEEAIALANSGDYGLAASVWSDSLEKAEKIAKRINAGSIIINECLKNIANSSLPFGGIKDSGMGRYHGDDGVYFFSDKVSVLASKSGNSSEINWFPYENDLYPDFKNLILFVLSIKKFGVSVLKSLMKLKNRMKR